MDVQRHDGSRRRSTECMMGRRTEQAYLRHGADVTGVHVIQDRVCHIKRASSVLAPWPMQ